MTRRPDFAARAADYDRLRPAGDAWWRLFDVLVEEADLRGRRVLDVGCGTGRLAAALAERAVARVWAIDPVAEMLEIARRRGRDGIGFKLARAEELPFRDGWFDAAVYWLSVHLVDRPRAFAETARVLARGGRLALVTFDPEHFTHHWLNPWFPSIEPVDRARFPTPDELATELSEAGFAGMHLLPIRERAVMTRAVALERIRGGHISTFDLLDPEEVRSGTERAERELPDEIAWEPRWLVVVADRSER
jgi:SAM-dependent methyltransferase